MSSLGKAMPQSTTMIVSLHSKAVMFMPICSRPPSGIILTFAFGSKRMLPARGSLARFKSSASWPFASFFLPRRGSALRRGLRGSAFSAFRGFSLRGFLPLAVFSFSLPPSVFSAASFFFGFRSAFGFSAAACCSSTASPWGFSARRRRGRFGLSSVTTSSAPSPASAASFRSARLFSERRLKKCIGFFSCSLKFLPLLLSELKNLFSR